MAAMQGRLFKEQSEQNNKCLSMRFLPQKPESRREFFRGAARYGLLSLLAAAASLSARKRTLTGQRCVNRGLCGNCGVFEGCGLPQALSAKRYLKREA